MPTTEENRIRQQRRLYEQSATSLGPVKFMPAYRNQVGVKLMNAFKRLLAKPLHSIGVKKNAPLLADRPQLGDRLDGTGLIIGGHHRN